MADKDFVVKNGLVVNTDLIVANTDSNRVGINTSSPDSTLTVSGTANVSGNAVFSDKVTVGNTISVGSNATISGHINVASTANVGGAATLRRIINMLMVLLL
jgi:acyl-[acyl carrier protein]--UDP-N-acetylglucosamine O-acyltransferase